MGKKKPATDGKSLKPWVLSSVKTIGLLRTARMLHVSTTTVARIRDGLPVNTSTHMFIASQIEVIELNFNRYAGSDTVD
jgi:hypothetical protein